MSKRPLVVLLFTCVVLAGCVTVPTGPSVFVLPGSQKSLDQFRVDDAACRQYAIAVLGGPAAAQPAQAGSFTVRPPPMIRVWPVR